MNSGISRGSVAVASPAAAPAAAVAAAPTAAPAPAVPAATAAATAAAAEATTAAALAGLGLVDGQRPAIVLLAVERGDRRLRLFVRTHLHEPEAFAPAGVAVADHLSAAHRAVLREQLLQLRAVHVVAQVSDVQPPAHQVLLYCALGRLVTVRPGADPKV